MHEFHQRDRKHEILSHLSYILINKHFKVCSNSRNFWDNMPVVVKVTVVIQISVTVKPQRKPTISEL